MEPLDYSTLTIQEVPVTGPDGKHYILREASGKAATDQRNAVVASAQIGPDGKVVGIKNLASVEAKFVADCLWDDKGKNPPVALVLSWPARVQKQLYEVAKELSDLGEESSLYEAFENALGREDSPISLEDLSKWVSILTEDEFKPLVDLFKRHDLKNS